MRLLALLAIFANVASGRGLPYFDKTDLTPYWETAGHSPARVESFHAVDQNGTSVTEQDFTRGFSIVNFFFAECGSTCPRMMATMIDVAKRLGPDVSLFSFSISPRHDTPKVLKDYVGKRGIRRANWRFVTGERTEIFRVGKAMFKADRTVGRAKNDLAFTHSENVYLVDSDRHIRGIYDTNSAEQMALLASDIRASNPPRP